MRLAVALSIAALLSLGLVGSDTALVTIAVSGGATECDDGIDNDGDGDTDYNPDISVSDDGCWDPSDDNESAGLPAGTSLVTTGECSSGNLTSAGNTYNNCDWSGGVTINAANITIVDSHIGGSVTCGSGCTTLLIEDTDIEGPTTQSMTLGSPRSGTYRRVRARLFPQVWYSRSDITIEDSVSRDTVGSGDCHLEPILANEGGGGTGQMTVLRTRLSANLHASATCNPGTGFTAVVAIHADQSFWGTAQNKRFENVRFETDTSLSYCLYGGSLNPDTQNIDVINSVFGGNCVTNDVTLWASGRTGTEWSGNVKGDSLAGGTPFSEP